MSLRPWILAALLLPALGAWAADPAPVSPTAQPAVSGPQAGAAPAALSPSAAPVDDGRPSQHNGLLLAGGLAQYWVSNGTPLSYRLELGYQFRDVAMLRTGMDTWYYVGDEGNTRWSYAYTSWISTATWFAPLDTPVQPFAELSFEVVTGQRSADQRPDAPIQAAPGFTGLGLGGGVAWRFTPEWLVSAQGRYTFAFVLPNMASAGLTFYRLF